MPALTVVRGARQLLTLRGPSGPRRGSALSELGIIPDGALLIRDGIIEEIGPTRRVENLAAARDARQIDASGRVVLPGFVDCFANLLAGEESAKRLEARARVWLEAMGRHGTTAAGSPAKDAKDLRVLAALDVVAVLVATTSGAEAPRGLKPALQRNYRRGRMVVAVPAGRGAFLIDPLTVLLPGRDPSPISDAAIALGSGFDPGNPSTFSMQMAVSLACARLGMTPAEAIAAATINAAHALGCADRAGSLETGKRADLVLFNASDYREIPYYFGANQVHLVLQRGVPALP